MTRITLTDTRRENIHHALHDFAESRPILASTLNDLWNKTVGNTAKTVNLGHAETTLLRRAEDYRARQQSLKAGA